MVYTEQNRTDDYNYFVDNYDELFSQFGDCFLAIQDKNVLGSFETVTEALEQLSDNHPVGTYILQKCVADKEDLVATMMRLIH